MDDLPRWRQPVTIRERVAWALAHHDTYGDTRYTRLLDEELAALTAAVAYLESGISGGVRRHGVTTGELHPLLDMEREARGWNPPRKPPHYKMRAAILEETWMEWLPMADAALTVIAALSPETARVMQAESSNPYPGKPDPDPLPPDRPRRPPPKGDGPPPKRAKVKKAA